MWVVAALVILSFVPAWSVGGVRLRRANILSEVVRWEADTQTGETELPYDETDFDIDLEAVSEQVAAVQEQFTTAENDPAADPADPAAPAADSAALETCYVWNMDDGCPASEERTYTPDEGPVTPIEDFDTTGHSPMERLYLKCAHYGTRVRIAFLGDSFVEGDILTADLRERLQERFGGCGCGFAPAASPLTGFRRTVRTTSRGWSSYNIMQRRTTPADLSARHIVSGWVCRPEQGASTRWECTDARRCIDSCREANLLFSSREESRVEVTVNDSLHRTFSIAPAAALRRISVRGTIRSIEMKVLEGQAGFIGYGAQLGGDGVVVDNYSIRSNNGQAMFWSDPALNAQLDHEVGGYDLVVLQYGLNIMQNGVDHYTNYATQLGKMIAYVRRCFPRAAVLVMGVSDRSTRSAEGDFVPMQAAKGLTRYQREAARAAGAAFWSTYDAMQRLGGMAGFVQQGWAGKDYTHINYAGGREVAAALYRALYREVCRKQQQERAQREEELNRRLPEVRLPSLPLPEAGVSSPSLPETVVPSLPLPEAEGASAPRSEIRRASSPQPEPADSTCLAARHESETQTDRIR